jgi:hypothetical protein
MPVGTDGLNERCNSIMGVRMKPEAALFLFHLRVGVRLALRVLAPVLAVMLFLFYVLGPWFTLELARILFLESSPVESGVIGTLLLLALARVVAPRISAGGAGWTRSLPMSGSTRHRLAVLSMVVAQAPLLAVLCGLAWSVAGPNPARIAMHIAGLLVGAAAAGLASLPAPAIHWKRLLPAAACFLSFSGSAAGLGAAAVLLVLSVAYPGKRAASRKERRPRRNLPSAAFFLGLSLRAVRGLIVLAYLPPLIVLGAARLFLMNNALEADTAFSLSLFGIILSLVAFIGPAADVLAGRRPAWPWSRSLPRSAALRVSDDALYLALHALPLAFGLALLGRPAREAALLAGPLAWLSLRGAGAMRTAGDRPFGVLGQIFVEGTILSLTVALLPWTSWLLVGAAPIAFLIARNAEQRHKPTRWTERHHSNAGDPLSWSAS